MKDIKQLALDLYKKYMDWFYESLGNQVDYRIPEIDNDTPLDDLLLELDEENEPFRSALIKKRLKGEDVYSPDIQTILDPIFIEKNDIEEIRTDEYTQGKLVTVSEFLKALGCTEEAEIALDWGTWNPLE